jgi:hypothetical protein
LDYKFEPTLEQTTSGINARKLRHRQPNATEASAEIACLPFAFSFLFISLTLSVTGAERGGTKDLKKRNTDNDARFALCPETSARPIDDDKGYA